MAIPPISDTPIDIVTTATVNNPDGSLFYYEAHTFTNCNREMQEMIYGMLDAQQKFLDAEKENQKKEPDAIFSAVLTATGITPDLKYDAFTYDMFQRALHNWNKLGEQVVKAGEKRIKGKGKP